MCKYINNPTKFSKYQGYDFIINPENIERLTEIKNEVTENCDIENQIKLTQL